MAPLFLAAAIGCLAAASTPARPAFGAVSPHGMGDGASFWISEGANDRRTGAKVDPRRATRTALFDVARLRADLAKLLGNEPPGQGVPFADFALFEGDTVARFRLEQETFTVDLTSGVVARSADKSRTTRRSASQGLHEPHVTQQLVVVQCRNDGWAWFGSRQ